MIRLSKILRAAVLAGLASAFAAGLATARPTNNPHKVNKTLIAKIIKSEMAETIAGINALDVEQATKYEAADIVTMDAGRPPSMNLKDDKAGMAMAFKAAPSWRVRIIDESIDVADAGDMAIYRCTAWQDSSDEAGGAMTEKVNFLAGFKKEKDDAAWLMAWSAVVPQERPHKK